MRIFNENDLMPGAPAMPQKKIIKVVATIAAPVLAATGFPIAGALIGAAGGLFGGDKQKAPAQDNQALLAAQQRQAALQAQTEAVQQRQLQQVDEREAELSKQLAGQRRATAARQRGSNSLSFTAPSSGLKTTLGG